MPLAERGSIGKRVHINWDEKDDEVIGVVGDVKHVGLAAKHPADDLLALSAIATTP